MSAQQTSENATPTATQAGSGDPGLRRTPLHEAHVALGARMVPFAGYEMPVQYPMGVLKEHLWTREKAGIFDVAHMGIAYLAAADGRHETVAAALEALVPADVAGLPPGRQRYTQLTNDDGGIIDDLMVSRSADPDHDGWLFLVLNASRKDIDCAHIESRLPNGVTLSRGDGFALMALQGPMAEEVLATHDARVRDMPFMSSASVTIAGCDLHITRSGYTGEDGFELPVPVERAAEVWKALLDDERVAPIGLGARDSLRLEAGLCLYGNDIDETTTPVEAALVWSIGKPRRPGGERAGGFPGADIILAQIAGGPPRRRVGLAPTGRAPVRAGADLYASADGGDGTVIGRVTSGGFGPSVGGPIAMGYVPSGMAQDGQAVFADVRGKRLEMLVSTSAGFVTNNYKRA